MVMPTAKVATTINKIDEAYGLAGENHEYQKNQVWAAYVAGRRP